MSKKSFVKGAAILAAAGLAAKFIGALFRIPLTNMLGTDGIGLYGMAYPIYSFLLIVSTSGIPTAISKLIAEKLAVNNYAEAHKVFRLTLRLMLIVGLSTFFIFSAGSGVTARIIGDQRAIYSILAIAPSLVFVSLISVYRGFFQGMQYMTPTALSQIVEQVGKLILGLWFASIFLAKGTEYGAAAAVVGVTLSEFAALVLLMGMYRRKRRDILDNINKSQRMRHTESGRSILGRLIRIAVPITIGASIMPLVNVADTLIVTNRLKSIGYAQNEATSLFGLITQSVNPLINFPAVLTIALAMSLVPAIAESYARKDYKSIAQKTTTGIRLSLLLGLPAAAGMAVLSEPICSLLYKNLSQEEITTAGILLAILSVGVIFLTLVQTLSAILQGLGKVSVPVKNLAIGALFKVVITYMLVGNPALNVKGAAIGTIVCYGVAAVLDFAAAIRYSRTPVPFMDFLVKPVCAVGVMSLAVYGAYKYSSMSLSNTKATFVSILIGVIVYGILLLAIGAVRKQDFDMLPKGKKIGNMLAKLKLLRD